MRTLELLQVAPQAWLTIGIAERNWGHMDIYFKLVGRPSPSNGFPTNNRRRTRHLWLQHFLKGSKWSTLVGRWRGSKGILPWEGSVRGQGPTRLALPEMSGVPSRRKPVLPGVMVFLYKIYTPRLERYQQSWILDKTLPSSTWPCRGRRFDNRGYKKAKVHGKKLLIDINVSLVGWLKEKGIEWLIEWLKRRWKNELPVSTDLLWVTFSLSSCFFGLHLLRAAFRTQFFFVSNCSSSFSFPQPIHFSVAFSVTFLGYLLWTKFPLSNFFMYFLSLVAELPLLWIIFFFE